MLAMPPTELPKQYRARAKHKAYDILTASPLIIWYTFTIFGVLPKLVAASRHQMNAPDAVGVLTVIAQAVTIAFLGLQVVLFALRRPPIAYSHGMASRIMAIVGANIIFLYLAIPRAILQLPTLLIAISLVIVGTAASIYVALHLNASFSVFPQARRLVMTGPYRYVRHPLYLTEQIATIGLMLQFKQPWGIIIGLISFAAQFPRMSYEEKILPQTFPEYREYMAKTARLIPGAY